MRFGEPSCLKVKEQYYLGAKSMEPIDVIFLESQKGPCRLVESDGLDYAIDFLQTAKKWRKRHGLFQSKEATRFERVLEQAK